MKKYVKDSFIELEPGLKKRTNFFITKTILEYKYLNQKTVNSTFQLKNENVQKYQKVVNQNSSDWNNLFTGYLRLDEKDLLLKPAVYGITDWLAYIGGLCRSLFFIFELANMFLGR